jgi:hypothetical protein
MATFSAEFEKLWAKRSKDLGRDLTSEESAVLRSELFHLWIDDGRLDDLIRTVHANHGRDGGLEEIIVLGYHLRETKDADRIHALFRGLISRRVKAFYDWWPRASTGHVGCMKDAARAMAEAMDAYTEYFISLHKLGLQVECDQLREEMKKFQAREKMSAVLPKAKKENI